MKGVGLRRTGARIEAVFRFAARAAAAGAAALCLSWAGAVGPAAAFVLEGPAYRPWSPIEDIARAARWDANTGALAETGERGLGGGLEYAVDASVCEKLKFLDDPAPDCATIKAAIRAAMDRWSINTPSIRFVDVSDKVGVRMQGRALPADGQGAEIDFIAMGPESFLAFANRRIGAMTNYFFDVSRRPRLTNGGIGDLAAGVLTAADVRLSTRACYFMDTAFEQLGCAHFPSLIKHEIGHVLGVEHPDQFPERNITPAQALAQEGCAGTIATVFQVSDAVALHAAARSVLFGADVWRHGLADDDLAARDALYPPCTPAGVTTTMADLGNAPTTAFAAGGEIASAGAIGALTDKTAVDTPRE